MKNMDEILENFEIETLIITGAGFSRDAGLPLENEVIPKSLDIFRDKDPNFITQLSKKANNLLNVENVFHLPIEEILTRVKIIEFYSRPPKNHYRDISPVEQGILKLFSHVLRLPENNKIPLPYYDFVTLFKDKTAFVTFNNDILMETIFDMLKFPWSYFVDQDAVFDLEKNSYHKSLIVTKSKNKENELIPYLKLHGSFNWHYCWKCNTVRISSQNKFGVPLTGLPELWFFMLNCMNEKCLQKDGARPMLESLIIAPTLIKYYDLKFIQNLWTYYEFFLHNVNKIFIIGSSLRNEDALFLNSLSNLNIKNKKLEEIVFINPDESLVNKVTNLTNLKILYFKNIEEYLSRI